MCDKYRFEDGWERTSTLNVDEVDIVGGDMDLRNTNCHGEQRWISRANIPPSSTPSSRPLVDGFKRKRQPHHHIRICEAQQGTSQTHNQMFSSTAIRKETFGLNTRMIFLNRGSMIKPPSYASASPAPREIQTEYLSLLRPARRSFAYCEYQPYAKRAK